MNRALEPSYVGTVWPNGEFGVSREREISLSSPSVLEAKDDETEFNRAAIAAHGAVAVLEFRAQQKTKKDTGLSQVPKSHSRAKRGLKGITSHGKKLTRCAAAELETRYGSHLLTFGTVTLPSLSKESALCVARNWSEIVRQFVQNLGRDLVRRSLPKSLVAVTEIQEARFATSGIPALHLHFVFVGRNSRRSAWAVTRKDVRDRWADALRKYVPSDTNFDATENVQQVRKSAAGYLGKYMSKGSEACKALVAKGFTDWLPSAWYVCTKKLRVHVLAQRVRGQQAGWIVNWMCESGDASLFCYVSPVSITLHDGSRFAVGYVGRFSKAGKLLFESICASVCTR